MINAEATGPVPVAIALGSNLGDRPAQIDAAVARLATVLSDLRVSSAHLTAPVGVDIPQPDYLNAVVVGRTALSARALLARLLQIEQALGRTRPSLRAPRTIDLDLILFGDAVLDEPDLQVPHPRFRERAFVLDPLAELAPDLVDPVTGLTIRALRDRLHAL